MALSRRTFLTGFGPSPVLAALVSARGLEEVTALGLPAIPPPAADEVRIGGNENPLGPGKHALDALIAQLDQSNRYPFNSRVGNRELLDALSDRFDAAPENFVVGAGSSEILRNSVRIFCTPVKHVVTGRPSYGSPVTESNKLGVQCRQIALDDELRLDLPRMLDATRGAGMVYVCNPNNPTATIHPASSIERFVDDVQAIAPDALILLDEAYYDYVTDSAGKTLVPLAKSRKNIVVLRTFSKAYGMAGLRLGFGCGHPETIAKLRRFSLSANANVLAIAAGVASLLDPAHIEQERERNQKVRRFTLEFFESAGYRSTDTQTNFLFVNLGRPAKEFREACARDKIFVARDFPPMEKTHCRISIGTMNEMQRATAVFAKVLDVRSSDADAGGAQ